MEKQENAQAQGLYTMETKVRYSECGVDRQAGLCDVLDYLQDTCTFQAEELGVGLAYMQAHQTGWILNSWQADIGRYPVFGETLRVMTWPYRFQGFLGFRNFKIEDETGETIVRANSVWVFMDMQKNRPVKVPLEVAAAFQQHPKLEMAYMDRKIADFEAGTPREPVQVPRCFIDTNHHVNNVKYVLLAQELLPADFKAARIRVEYKRAAVCGETLYPFIQKQQGHWAVKFSDGDGKPYACMEFYADI